MKIKEEGGGVVYGIINLAIATEPIVSDQDGLLVIHHPNNNSEGRGSSEGKGNNTQRHAQS